MKTTLYLGPPGTGKTTTLLSLIEEKVRQGIEPSRIGYISFTKAAVDEAIKRTARPLDELDYFRTIHSMCFRLKGFSTSMVIGRDHYEDFSNRMGIDFSGRINQSASFDELSGGDRALALIDIARMRQVDLKLMWEKLDSDIQLDWNLVDLINRAFKKYKQNNFLIDYTDMLEQYLVDGNVPDIDILIVDEAQDLSHLQWAVVRKLSLKCQELIFAGDDDQAIYHWSGVDVADMLEINRTADRVELLSKSWRLPRNIFNLSQNIAGRINHRIRKEFYPREEGGTIDRLVSLEEADLSKGSWLCLTRNRYMMADIVELCLRNGFVYSCLNDTPAKWPSVKAAYCWEGLRKGKEASAKDVRAMLKMSGQAGNKNALRAVLDTDEMIQAKQLQECGINLKVNWFDGLDKIRENEAEYIRATLRRGEKLTNTPRIRIGTIHGAKGSEEENVLLMTDQSYKTWNSSRDNHEDEDRVFYVGVTRAKNRLCIVEPQTPYYYSI